MRLGHPQRSSTIRGETERHNMKFGKSREYFSILVSHFNLDDPSETTVILLETRNIGYSNHNTTIGPKRQAVLATLIQRSFWFKVLQTSCSRVVEPKLSKTIIDSSDELLKIEISISSSLRHFSSIKPLE